MSGHKEPRTRSHLPPGLTPPHGQTPAPWARPTRKQESNHIHPCLAWPFLSEALRLHRHPLGLLCYDCDQTRHLNLTLLDTCRRYLPEILRYHAHWTYDVFPGVTDLHLCQFFSTRPGFDDSPSSYVRFCVCSKSRPRAKFPEVTLGVCGNRHFGAPAARCHTVS